MMTEAVVNVEPAAPFTRVLQLMVVASLSTRITSSREIVPTN